MRLSVYKSHLFSLQSSRATVDSPRGETWPTDRSCWHRSSIKAVPWLNTILFNCNGRVWFFFLPFIWIKEVIFHRRSRLWNSFILIVLRHTALQSVYVILYMLCAPTNVFGICVITQDGVCGGVHSLNVTEISRTFLWNTGHLIHSLHRVTSALQGPFSYGVKWWLGEASLGKSISSFFFPNAAASGQCYLPWFYIWLHKRAMFAQWGSQIIT